jgi:hypothetical protein
MTKETVEESKVPESRESLWEISWHYVEGNSRTNYLWKYITKECNRNVRATKEQAEASIALSQLSQLRQETLRRCWNRDPKSDFYSKVQYTVRIDNVSLRVVFNFQWSHFLSFPTEDICNEFIDKHRELILRCSPLLG